jgi:hypothetical protein
VLATALLLQNVFVYCWMDVLIQPRLQAASAGQQAGFGWVESGRAWFGGVWFDGVELGWVGFG